MLFICNIYVTVYYKRLVSWGEVFVKALLVHPKLNSGWSSNPQKQAWGKVLLAGYCVKSAKTYAWYHPLWSADVYLCVFVHVAPSLVNTQTWPAALRQDEKRHIRGILEGLTSTEFKLCGCILKQPLSRFLLLFIYLLPELWFFSYLE